MKKLIIILALGIISCSTPEQAIEECKCYKVYYTYQPTSQQGGTWIWDYVETSKELFSSGGECPQSDYIQITGGKYYRIECR